MHCMRRGSHPPYPPFARGESWRRLVFFPPLRRGDTGEFFECLCVTPGSASRRLKTALATFCVHLLREGHERPGLLVAGQNSRDPAAAPQGVVNCRRVRPGHAEYVVNAAADEALHQYVGTCSGHLPGAPKECLGIRMTRA